MLDVSKKFLELAQAPGRRVYCKIVAGDVTFRDDRILEFDFDDIVHPEWVTAGTTCSNRFAFSVRYDGEIDVHTEIRPYISFDDSEWCPLGVFYVERRYIRGKYSSITCYDRMYSLDIGYSTSLKAPARTQDMLKEICSAYDIDCDDFGLNETVSVIPTDCTVKDVIGYISAISNACAKFDRYGKLVLTRYSSSLDFFLQPANCMDFSRNMSHSIIRKIVADTGDKILETGEGSDLSTLEIYNPMIDQTQLDHMLLRFLPMDFYGAEIEMQGMPFLESGDHIRFEETPGRFYPIVISEMDYHYDGALTAKLYSKNKHYTDAAVHQNDLEAALAELKAGLENIYLKQVNDEEITLKTAETTIADFEFVTKKADVFAQIDLNFTVDGGGSNMLAVSVYVNENKDRTSYHTVDGSTRELVHFYYLAENLPKGKNKITVAVSTASGQMTVQKGQLIATLVGKGMAGGGSNIRDRTAIVEPMQAISSSFGNLSLTMITENLQTE